MQIKPILNGVTITGADDSTDVYGLLALSEAFPFVEFGILLSKKCSMQNGAVTRFPSRAWLQNLADVMMAAESDFRLSGHLCGSWVRELLLGQWPQQDLDSIHLDLESIFSRFQINTHAELHNINLEKLEGVVRHRDFLKQEVIFQIDGVNDILPRLERGLSNVSGLFDLSHGAGILPAEWPSTRGLKCGYAGGLSPENVQAQLFKIQNVCGENPVWIDAETNLYSDRQFDLDKCRDFLSAAEPWVIK